MTPCPPLAFAFAGFRHVHVFSLVERIRQTPGATILAAWEEDEDARNQAKAKGVDCPFVDTLEELLALPIQVLVVGEVYARREAIIIAALERGIHVLSDKPFCTSLEGWKRINFLCNKSRKVPRPKLGCMFDLGTCPPMATASRLAREGALGEILSVQFNGMHPLNYHKGRPDWYFQEGMHGGTVNDLACHAFDFLPRLCGCPVDSFTYVRDVNRYFPECPHFKNVAKLAFEMKCGARVTGDVSYTAPRGCAFSLPSYWRFTVAGTKGWMEFSYAGKEVLLALEDDPAPRAIPLDPQGEDYFDGFLKEIQGQESEFSTQSLLKTAWWSLCAQSHADDMPDDWRPAPKGKKKKK
ncbi:MAG: Gfo/Idh/MocA family protein [Oligosphaeraceae bacterium]